MSAPKWLSVPERDWDYWISKNIPKIYDKENRPIIVADLSRAGQWVTASCAIAADQHGDYIIARMVEAINTLLGTDFPTDTIVTPHVDKAVTVEREKGWLIAKRRFHLAYK